MVLTPSKGKLIINTTTHNIVINKFGSIILLKIFAIPSTSPATILLGFKNQQNIIKNN